MNVTPDPRTALNRRRLLQLGGTGAVAAALAACSGGDNGGSGGASASATPLSSESLAAELAKPAELTFWTWVPDITDEVALFTAAYPNIKVNVVNAGQSADEYTKLRTALKAGTGAPDVVQIEFPYIPTFTFTNDLLDLTPYGAADLKADYVDWTWSQVTSGDGIYAIPQDTGPLGMLYRDDIFTQYGLTPPTTWQEFADTGTQLHAANPSVSMMNYASNDAGQTFGYSWQAGARPFALDGETVTIKLNSPEMKKVASFWDPLVKAGVVTTDTDFNNDWYAALTNGNYATWVTAAWAPVFLQSSAAASAGKWRATAMPQWNAGDVPQPRPRLQPATGEPAVPLPPEAVDAVRPRFHRPGVGLLRRAAGQRTVRRDLGHGLHRLRVVPVQRLRHLQPQRHLRHGADGEGLAHRRPRHLAGGRGGVREEAGLHRRRELTGSGRVPPTVRFPTTASDAPTASPHPRPATR
jgi:ABC-type glycerol-3-phosphate transport system substrate-binding protein